ncbi:E3 ubiquitin-protein ligase [Mactra antiquata]
MMSFFQRLAKSLRSARTVDLPEDSKSAFYMLMSMVIANQHKSIAELLASSKYDINYSCGKAQRTLLHISANCGSYECLCLLIKKGSNVNYQDVSGCTPLHLAARNGQKKCIIKLLENKANVNIRNNDGLTMIHWLAVNGRGEVLQDLFDYIKDVDIEDAQGQTALHVACQNGHKSTAQCLLDHGADINRPNKFGWTPLHFACSHGQHDTANFLLTRGCRVSISSSSLDHINDNRMSIRQGGSDSTQLKSPLELCVLGGYSETCDILIRFWPNLFPNLISMVGNLSLDESMILKVLRYICVNNHYVLAVKVLSHLAIEANNVGHDVLSTSVDGKSQISCLHRYIHILTRLYQEYVTLRHKPEDINHTVESSKLQHVFEPLEALWTLMEEWLNIAKVEITKSSTSKTEDKIKCVQSSNTDVHNDQGDSGKQDVAQSNDSQSIPEDIVNRTNKLLTTGNQPPDDILDIIVPRLCSILQAFYMVCSCVDSKDMETSPKFIQFFSSNESTLEAFIERNPSVIFDHLRFLLDIPELNALFLPVIRKQPFEARRRWFYEYFENQKELNSNIETDLSHDEDTLMIQRDVLFRSSCSQIMEKDPEKLKRNLNLRFHGEEGMGQGVVREWFDVLSKEILNPDYALFTQSADGCTFQPNSNSSVNPDHLNYFRFAGQCFGLALYHKQLINAYFTRSFYKHILGIPLSYTDVASIDPEYAKNLQWILDHEIEDLGLDLTFSVETDVFGIMEEVDLKPNGNKILVTDSNKSEYVQLVTELRMTRAIQPQIENFLSGFHQFIPSRLIRMFDEYELELLLSGIPEIDLEDWKQNTNYVDCSEDYDIVKWFWEILGEINEQEKVLMLQFATGSSRLPYGGFSKLSSGDGPQKFTISLVRYTQDLLPSASTCINFLRLPDYPSKELAKQKLLVALQCGSQGYGMT